ncbi:MAG TPA: SRPBCC family protein [Chloroflexota bacterium]|nr:SRPBCC family protein [Chloroflexota bacterium]
MQRAEKSIRVAAPVEQVYAFWRNFENLPRFMEHVKDVRRASSNQELWHWTLKGPLNSGFEFDARVTEDQPNKSIGWNSTHGSLGTSGVVTFRDLQSNTEVHVLMQWFDPPGGKLGEALSQMVRNPGKMLEEDLRRFKDLMERRLREDVGGEPLAMKSTLD